MWLGIWKVCQRASHLHFFRYVSTEYILKMRQNPETSLLQYRAKSKPRY